MIVRICTETVSRGGRGDVGKRSRKRRDRKILRVLLSTSPRPPRETTFKSLALLPCKSSSPCLKISDLQGGSLEAAGTAGTAARAKDLQRDAQAMAGFSQLEI